MDPFKNQKIEEILTRGVNAIYEINELKELLNSGKTLNLKLGTDVTGPLIHLGHAVIHRKIRDFQEMGHKLTLIIGDYTTLIGDHSDKIDMREDTTLEIIKENEKNYKEQFFKTVIPELTEIRHNSEWLSKLDFNEIIHLAKQFTVAQMIERDNFKMRYMQGKPIRLSEFLYPLMQGYDSVYVKSDIEFGGTDQTFNILAGRHLMEVYGLKPQIGFTMKLLRGNDGRKMGKSLKNFIPVNSGYIEMYTMIMQITDEVIVEYFEFITRVPMEQVKEIQERINLGENPMLFKKRLAYEIVSFYHGEEKAKLAQEEFERVVQGKGIPKDLDLLIVKKGSNIIDTLTQAFKYSRTEAKRLIDQRAIKYNNYVIDSYHYNLEQDGILVSGKKNYISIKIA